jgi:hypothetical protein
MVDDIPVLEKLTVAEIDEILDDVGLPCLILDGCDWIPLKTTPQEQEMQEMLAFHRKLLEGMVGIPPEFNKVFVDNFEDLLA